MTNADAPAPAATLTSANQKAEADRLQREFYFAVLNTAEKTMAQTAEKMGGLDPEVAVLRIKLRNIVGRKAGSKTEITNLKLMIRAMDMLNRLLSTRYRISKKSREELADSLASVLQSVRSELGLGEDHGP